jgi:hypothetical protein
MNFYAIATKTEEIQIGNEKSSRTYDVILKPDDSQPSWTQRHIAEKEAREMCDVPNMKFRGVHAAKGPAEAAKGPMSKGIKAQKKKAHAAQVARHRAKMANR